MLDALAPFLPAAEPPAASEALRIAIVGRPNVGKSSLFNWLAGRRIAIVDPTAGVTRDRVSAPVTADGRYFELVDTGGMGIQDVDNLTAQIEQQKKAIASTARSTWTAFAGGRSTFPATSASRSSGRMTWGWSRPVPSSAGASGSHDPGEPPAPAPRPGRGLHAVQTRGMERSRRTTPRISP